MKQYRKILAALLALVCLLPCVFSCEIRHGQTPENPDTMASPDESATKPVTEPPTETAGGQTEESKPAQTDPVPETKEPETEKPAPVKTVPIGFYGKNSDKTKRVRYTEHVSDWTVGKDICLIGVFLSDEESFPSGKFVDNWNDCVKAWKDARPVKIGYLVSFTFWETGETHSVIVTRPEDWKEYWDVFEIYVYDDIEHAEDSWYDHVDPDEFTDQTILTEIKLTAGKSIDKLTSTITLTCFAYEDESVFSKEKGEYYGADCATITVRNRAYVPHEGEE